MNFLSALIYMIPGFIATGLVIFIHELGHYAAAKALGAEVEVLGFGIGPVVWRHYGRNTEFRISLIPFGGYCRIGGSEDLTVALENNNKTIGSSQKGSFFAIAPWRKFLIFLSGPLANVILAIALMTIVSSLPVERTSHSLFVAPVSAYPTLFEGDLPEVTSIRKGDRIISSGSREFIDWEDFSSFLKEMDGKDVPLRVERNGEVVDVIVVSHSTNSGTTYGICNLEESVIGRSESELFLPGDRIIQANGKSVEWSYDIYSLSSDSFVFLIQGEDGRERSVEWNSPSLPFAWKTELRVSPDSKTPFRTALEKTRDLASRTAAGIMKLLSFRFSEALEAISGPFTSASTIGRISTLAFSQSARSGIRTLFYLLSTVSISIAIGNMIPIPSFDGGQMLITFFEMAVRRPLKPKTYLFLHISGVVVAWAIIIMMNSWGIIEKLFL